jgi:hypothetical protein
MPVHIVRQGETLAGIALAHGFTDPAVIWNRAENKSLADAGRTPATLAPDDSLFIPDRVTRELSASTGTRQTVTVHRKPVRLRLVLQRLRGKPVAGASVTLTFAGHATPVTTDGDGAVDMALDDSVETGELLVSSMNTSLAGVRIPLLVGHLDPVAMVSGQEARLNSLGYRAGIGGDPAALAFRSAVEEFQCDEGLLVDGICGAKTQARLVRVHGS